MGKVKAMELCSVFISCTVTAHNPVHALGQRSGNDMMGTVQLSPGKKVKSVAESREGREISTLTFLYL